MDDIQKLQKYIIGKKYDKLIELIDDYIDEVKRTLHDDNPELLDLTKGYEFTIRCGKMATILSENANVSNERYLFDGGYFTALVEELELLWDRLERVREWETAYRELSGKKHYVDILKLLYSHDLVQSRVISERLNLRPNYLSKIMKDMLDRRVVIVYGYSKYKYYGLTWEFKKYLSKIGFREQEIEKNRNNCYITSSLESNIKLISKSYSLTSMCLNQDASRMIDENIMDLNLMYLKLEKDWLIKTPISTRKKESKQFQHEELTIETEEFHLRKMPRFEIKEDKRDYLRAYGEKNPLESNLKWNGDLVGMF